MKPQSAKNKGRKLQQWVRDLLLNLGEPYGLKPDDVRSTSMGNSGEDVQMSPAARQVFPFQIECKNRTRMAVYADYKQAQQHGDYIPILVIKQNGDKPLVVIDAEYFFKSMY